MSMRYNNFVPPKLCEDGGIGRRARLRGEWLTAVRVRVSFLAPQIKTTPFRGRFFCGKIVGTMPAFTCSKKTWLKGYT